MGNELMIGSVGISVILTILLKMIYNTFNVPKRLKPWIAIMTGMALAVVVMLANSVPLVCVNIITYAVQGFMVGATAVGLNELMKKE